MPDVSASSVLVNSPDLPDSKARRPGRRPGVKVPRALEVHPPQRGRRGGRCHSTGPPWAAMKSRRIRRMSAAIERPWSNA